MFGFDGKRKTKRKNKRKRHRKKKRKRTGKRKNNTKRKGKRRRQGFPGFAYFERHLAIMDYPENAKALPRNGLSRN